MSSLDPDDKPGYIRCRRELTVNINKYIYIHNFGCQMNAHDALRIEETVRPLGFLPTPRPVDAHLILLNTCSVREKSHAKVLSAIGRYRLIKLKRPEVILAVAGCLAQQEGSRLLRAAPDLDLVFSPDHIAMLPDMLEKVESERRQLVRTGFVDPEEYRFLQAAPEGTASATALVTIQKGCDNRCSYCIVPSVRGPAVSRDASEILAEIERLVDVGVKEVTLIGQNVNSYAGGTGSTRDFIDLISSADAIPGLERMRFTTSHPRDFDEELATCFKDLSSLCPWLHLPVQSGSTRTLARMNRGYTREEYLQKIDLVRSLCPEIAIGTDFIVGFPGETEEDFQQTLSIIDKIQFDYSYSFKFSTRPGTRAEQLGDELSEEVCARRLKELQTLQNSISEARLSRFIGRQVPVLIEGPSRKGLPQLCGRTPGNKVVNIDTASIDAHQGHIVQVRIIRAGKHSLSGELAGDA